MKNIIKKLPFARRVARLLRGASRADSTGRGSLHVPKSEPSGSGATGGSVSSKSAVRAAANERRAEDFAIVRAEWRDQGATPELVARARAAARNSIAWNLLHPRIWLVYCGVLIEAGDREGAARLIEAYIAGGKPVEQLAQVLPVARLARELGVLHADIDRSARVADLLESNCHERLFDQFVAGKSVAVVGNGPGALGRALGKEIDAHDIVIRFNNFPDGFEEDYGGRTDIWVRGAHRDVRDRYSLEDFKLVVWEMDLFRNLLEVSEHADILYRDTHFSPHKVTHIDSLRKRTLWEASGLVLPTSGAQILWSLYQARGSLEGVDVYGFSSIDQSSDRGHYFDSLGDMGDRHNADGEGAFLRQLLSPKPEIDLDRDSRDAQSGTRRVVLSCAFREYDPSTGKTGGPAGVLATQQAALGRTHEGLLLDYRFREPGDLLLQKRIATVTAGLSAKVADIVAGAEVIRRDPTLCAAAKSDHKTLLVCHELGTAYGAYLLSLPYVLVYHQQGSTLREMESVGRIPTPHEARVANELERVVLENAQSVFFPSLGARDAYKQTAARDFLGRVRFSDWALYNTVSAVDQEDIVRDHLATLHRLTRELHLPQKSAQSDVFISVGDFNEDKGLDRVPALLEEYVTQTRRDVTWIAVGAGGSGSLFKELEAARDGWNFRARLIGERLSHDELLSLLEFADYYVMMHRTSIFDLATLEAMKASKPLILTPVGGNLEVDIESNVLFVDESSFGSACREIATKDRGQWGDRSRDVFDAHFSLAQFAGRYRRMLEEQVALLDHEVAVDA